MKFVFKVVVVGGVVASLGGLGCSAKGNVEETPAPVTDMPEDDTTNAQAAITVNGFTLNAQTPVIQRIPVEVIGAVYIVNGSVVISGGSGTAKMGVCAMRQHKDGSTPRACSTVADCADIAIDPGGARYCTNINNVGQKYCFTRRPTGIGCAGTPNTGAAVGNGTYTTALAGMPDPGSTWISYACVNGCSTTDPSVSSALAIAP